ncbi:MAG: hypothetical protein ABXS92_07445 [Sulfurimonas sp.]
MHASMDPVSFDESINIMLTPQFYTLKKESLPVSYAFQARRIAPSLFEGFLEEGAYEYLVYKEGGEWVFIAFDPKKITEFLVSKGLRPEQISKIFFAQQSHAMFAEPTYVSPKEALIEMDGTAVLIPQNTLGEEDTLQQIDNSFSPRRGVALHTAYNSLFTRKQTFSLAAVFVVFALLFLIEGVRYSDSSGTEELQAVLKQYPSLANSYTREAELSAYQKLDAAEREKRDAIKSISTMIFKGVELTSINLSRKAIVATFACKDKKSMVSLKSLAVNQKFSVTVQPKDNILKIKGAL